MDIKFGLRLMIVAMIIGNLALILSTPASWWMVIVANGPALEIGSVVIAEYVHNRKDEKLQRRLIVIEILRQRGIDPYSDAIWEYVDIDKIVR